jgi:hypothetical protein
MDRLQMPALCDTGSMSSKRDERSEKMASNDVHEAMNRLGVAAYCPICGHSGWIGVGDGTDLEVKLLAVDEAGELLDRHDRPGPPWLGVTCEVLLCAQCGWLRLHSVASIRRVLSAAAGASD